MLQQQPFKHLVSFFKFSDGDVGSPEKKIGPVVPDERASEGGPECEQDHQDEGPLPAEPIRQDPAEDGPDEKAEHESHPDQSRFGNERLQEKIVFESIAA